MKRAAASTATSARGRFDWMRRGVLWVVGGNFYWDTPTIIEFNDEPIVWINRDADGYLMLNVRMLTTTAEERAVIEDNFWLARGEPSAIESPPNGKALPIEYANGDMLNVQWVEVPSAETAQARWTQANASAWPVDYPLTAAEATMRVASTDFALDPNASHFGGFTMVGCFFASNRVGLSIRS